MHRDSTAVEFLEAGTPWKCAPHVFVTNDETGFMFFILDNLLNILFWQWSKNYGMEAFILVADNACYQNFKMHSSCWLS